MRHLQENGPELSDELKVSERKIEDLLSNAHALSSNRGPM